MISLTQSAKEYLYNIAKKNNKDIVSFGVSGGGCAGFSYKWDYLCLLYTSDAADE